MRLKLTTYSDQLWIVENEGILEQKNRAEALYKYLNQIDPKRQPRF